MGFLPNFFCEVKTEKRQLIKKAEENLFSDPNSTIKICRYISNSNLNFERPKAYLLLAKAYIVLGNYEYAMKYLFLAENEASKMKDIHTHTEALLILSELTHFLDLWNISTLYLKKADIITKKNKKESKIVEDYILVSKINSKKIQLDPKIRNIINSLSEINYPYSRFTKGTLLTQIASELNKKSENSNSNIYLEKTFNNLKNKNYDYWEVISLTEYSEFFFYQKKYQEALEILTEALKKEQTFNNPFIEEDIYEKLIKNEIALNHSKKAQEYYQKLSKINIRAVSQKNIAKNWFLNDYENKRNNLVKSQKISENRIIYGSIIISFIDSLINFKMEIFIKN